MGKMHELIAAEAATSATYNAMLDETAKVFDRPDAFIRSVSKKTHFDAEMSHLDVEEVKDMTTSVSDRLDYLLNGSFVKHVDLELNKDTTNQVAKADLIVSGKTIAKDVPATMLLDLEKEFARLRQLVLKVPTLAAGPEWITDEESGMFKTKQPIVTFTTKKTIKPIVLVAATDKHPAQVEKVSEDVPIAKVEKWTWSSMMTSAQKAAMLGRIDQLLLAAKQARMRANDAEATDRKIGQSIADYVLGR